MIRKYGGWTRKGQAEGAWLSPTGDYYDSPGDGQEEGARSTLPEGMFVETVLGGPPGVQPSVLLSGNGPGASSGFAVGCARWIKEAPLQRPWALADR